MRAVSIISIVYGALGLIWAAIVSMVIRIQRSIFENFPFPEEVYEYIDINAFMETIYSVIGALIPFIFVIAVIYIMSGILYLTGNKTFKILGYIAAISNITWYAAYIVFLQADLVPMINSMDIFPGRLLNMIFIAGMLINAVFYCGYPIFLILFLRKGREWDTLDTGYQS